MLSRITILGIPIKINWSDLHIGDSFFIPAPTGASEKLVAELVEVADCAGYKVAITEVAENGFMGVRVWRVQ